MKINSYAFSLVYLLMLIIALSYNVLFKYLPREHSEIIFEGEM